ncbi:MAG TPA: hypothetical protein VNG51_03240 [Ktedonobacteraceae bacterium]|nr:hypothetical protein [Ktedonobacteraceae bacterium]
MHEQNNLPVQAILSHPTRDNRAAWQQQGQWWRSEPEIDSERQQYVAERRAVKPDVRQGIAFLEI